MRGHMHVCRTALPIIKVADRGSVRISSLSFYHHVGETRLYHRWIDHSRNGTRIVNRWRIKFEVFLVRGGKKLDQSDRHPSHFFFITSNVSPYWRVGFGLV